MIYLQVMYTCKHCGRDFLPLDQSLAHQRRNPVQYCSRECGRHWRLSQVTVHCRQCGKALRRRVSHAAKSQERGPFCGFPCYGQWQRLHMRGEANPNFRQKSPRRAAGQWTRARLAAIDRDGRRCAWCGQTEKRLVVHHIRPWHPDDVDPRALDNLVTICDSCHRRRHAELEL